MRCASYPADFKLQCLLYDIAMARTISTVATLAASKHMAPEAIASDMDMFEAYWLFFLDFFFQTARLVILFSAVVCLFLQSPAFFCEYCFPPGHMDHFLFPPALPWSRV